MTKPQTCRTVPVVQAGIRMRSVVEKFSLLKIVCVVSVSCIATAIVSPAQTFTSLVRFNVNDGGDSGATLDFGSLAQGLNGDLYGTTEDDPNGGNVFGMSPEGKLGNLYDFCGQTNCTDGVFPYAGLLLARDGSFYGTTWGGGGDNQGGTVFSISQRRTLRTLYSFCSLPGCPDGAQPTAPLVQGERRGWELLRDYFRRWHYRRLRHPRLCRHSLQDHPDWYAHYAVRFLHPTVVPRRTYPVCRADPS
jgi:uncharacterized repeat protein (TIGR03803 family)